MAKAWITAGTRPGWVRNPSLSQAYRYKRLCVADPSSLALFRLYMQRCSKNIASALKDLSSMFYSATGI
jgi:hypothetical protein